MLICEFYANLLIANNLFAIRIIMMKLIVANWKMNPTDLKTAKFLFDSIKKGLKNARKAAVIICPPFVYLPLLFSRLSNGKKNSIRLGAQNCSWVAGGAFTGEISSAMLRDFGVKYVILGHSERRKIFGETNKMVAQKVARVLRQGMRPIICVGETRREKAGGKTFRVLEKEIMESLQETPKTKLKNVIIAYEPIWAIGTGVTPSIEQIDEILSWLQNFTKKPVIYGGSVKPVNAKNILQLESCNGVLVGSASLDLNNFLKIIKIAN